MLVMKQAEAELIRPRLFSFYNTFYYVNISVLTSKDNYNDK